MTRTLLLMSFVIIFAGCENPYSKYYQDFTGGTNILQDPQYLISNESPKRINGSDIDKDDRSMLENGYTTLGVSSFWASDVNQNDALKQAQKVHACTVLTYCKYKETVSGVAPMTVPTTQTSYHSGSVYGAGGSANYSGTSTTYGTRTSYVPYSYNRQDYYASYWIKTKPSRLGVSLDELTVEQRQKIGSNKGLYVFAVEKGSPAFDGDILSGDVIRRIDGQEIIDKNHFKKVLDKASDSITFEIFRDGKTIQKKVQLRF